MVGPLQPNKHMMSTEPTEQLLDAFKAAALSVTRLYKSSTAANAKARSDGYQDCIDDLLAFLDRERIGLGDGDGWKVRRWATERLEGSGADNGTGAGAQQAMESEDDVDKAETASSPEMQRSAVLTPPFAPAASIVRTDSAPPPRTTTPAAPVVPEPMPAYSTTLPTQDTFTFQSTVPYPQEPNLNIESLDLSDARTHDSNAQAPIFSQQQLPNTVMSPALAASRTSRGRHGSSTARPGVRSRLGKGSGQKRRIGDDLADIFNIGSLGYNGKDFFGGSSKRSRLN